MSLLQEGYKVEMHDLVREHVEAEESRRSKRPPKQPREILLLVKDKLMTESVQAEENDGQGFLPPDSDSEVGTDVEYQGHADNDPGGLRLTLDVDENCAPEVEEMKQFLLQFIDERGNPKCALGVHPSGKPDDHSLLKMMLTDSFFCSHSRACMPSTKKAEIGLLDIVSGVKGLPLYVYDSLRDWASSHSNGPSGQMDSRDKVIKNLVELAGTNALRPKTRNFHMPMANKTVELTTVSFHAIIYDLLTDVELCGREGQGFLFKGSTPLDKPRKDPSHLDDFDSGSRYIESFEAFQETHIDLPLPIQFFVDKTHLDLRGGLQQEPVATTLSIFSRRVRNKPSAWRSLGNIPIKEKKAYRCTRDALSDYHRVLDEILKDLVRVQKETSGMLFPLRFKAKFYMVRLRPYVMCIIGDTPGHNAMCARYDSSNARFMCRYCRVPSDKLDDPHTEWPRMSSSLVRQWREKGRAEMKRRCYHDIENAWDSCHFGYETLITPDGSRQRLLSDVHCCCPGEIVHAIQQGCHKRCLDGFYIIRGLNEKDRTEQINKWKLWYQSSLNKTKSKARKLGGEHGNAQDTTNMRRVQFSEDDVKEDIEETEDAMLEDDDISDDEDERMAKVTYEELAKSSFFGGQRGQELDMLSVRLGLDLQRQSDRDIPRVMFPRGVTQRTMICAAEQQGLMLLTLLIVCSEYCMENMWNKLGDRQMSGWIDVLENMMGLEEVMKTCGDSSIRVEDFLVLREFLLGVLEMMRDVVDRHEGNGMKIIKFHLIGHMIDDMLRYGSAQNVSGGPGERQHIDNVKIPGSTTQMRANCFDKQSMVRNWEHHTITKSKWLSDFSDAQIGLPESIGYVPMSKIEKEILNEERARSDKGGTYKADSFVYECGYYRDETAVGIGRYSAPVTSEEMNALGDGEYYIGMRHLDSWKSTRGKILGRRANLARDCTANAGFREVFEFMHPIVACTEKTFKIGTELRFKGKMSGEDVLLRCDPWFPKHCEPRFDWAVARVDDQGMSLVQVLGILDFGDDRVVMDVYNNEVIRYWNDKRKEVREKALGKAKKKQDNNDDDDIDNDNYNLYHDCLEEPGMYVIVQFFGRSLSNLFDPTKEAEEQQRAGEMSTLIFREGKCRPEEMLSTGHKAYYQNPYTTLIHVSNLLDKALVVRDFCPTFEKKDRFQMVSYIGQEQEELNVRDYLIVRPRHTWASIMVTKAKVQYHNYQTWTREKDDETKSDAESSSTSRSKKGPATGMSRNKRTPNNKSKKGDTGGQAKRTKSK